MRLILLRHAKSSWDDPSLPDNERPLAPRGQRAVVVIRQHLQATGVSVDLVLCSPAQRTRETWDGVRAGLRNKPEVRLVPDIYEATRDQLLDVLRQVERRYKKVLLIGHNPGIEDLARGLVRDGKRKALARLEKGFPTGAVATLSPEVDWRDLEWDRARLDDFVRPKDL
jgi:phosphohistidine phosphatase